MKRPIVIFTLLTLIAGSLVSVPAYAEVQIMREKQENANEVLVVWRRQNRAALQEMKDEFKKRTAQLMGTGRAGNDIELTAAYDNSFVRVAVPQGVSPDTFLKALQASPDVTLAEKNPPLIPLIIPNDEYYGKYQWNLPLIDIPAAWETNKGEGTIVAVIDSGIAYENYGPFRKAPDFAGTAFTEGYDFIDRDNHPNDEFGHGTHIAGILAATMDNQTGIAGTAPGVHIMPLKVLDKKGQGTVADLAEAVRWAADHGAKVINMSVGSYEGSQVLTDALAYAYGKGLVLIGATGNDGGEGLLYPAAISEYVIAVGATDALGKKAWYSNSGTGVDLLAPGGDIRVDATGDGFADGVLSFTFAKRNGITNVRTFVYTFAQGTSVAVPHVSAVAAMIASMGIGDPSTIRLLLKQSARDLGPVGWDKDTGTGLVNAARAIALAQAEMTSVLVKVEPEPEPIIEEPPAVPLPLPSSPMSEPTPLPAPKPSLQSITAEISFLNIFGRRIDSFVWWETPKILVKVKNQDGAGIENASVELRYRYQGGQDLGIITKKTRADGTVEEAIGPFPRKKTIEVGVLAVKDDIFSELVIDTFTIR